LAFCDHRDANIRRRVFRRSCRQETLIAAHVNLFMLDLAVYMGWRGPDAHAHARPEHGPDVGLRRSGVIFHLTAGLALLRPIEEKKKKYLRHLSETTSSRAVSWNDKVALRPGPTVAGLAIAGDCGIE
jgi:hypothetical protein